MYIHVFNSHRFKRTRYCDAPNPPVEIKSLDDGDGNFILSVVPVDLSVPVLCSDVNLIAKLSCYEMRRRPPHFITSSYRFAHNSLTTRS